MDRLNRRGTPLYALQKILKPRGVSIVEYDRSQPGEVFVTCSNTIPKNPKYFPNNIRLVAYFGSERRHQGMSGPSRNIWDRIDYGVFISNFYKDLVRYSISESSVINWIGGCPADSDALSPILHSRKIEGAINFIACAKWWKRPFKRLRQTIKLFNSYILKEYPQSQLHVLGCKISEDKHEGKIHYYSKSHGDPRYVDVWKKSHVHISLTPFDSGPMTLNEALHYKVPFVCTNNSAASDYTTQLGKCGEVVQIDPDIKSLKDFKKYKPFINQKHYDKEIDYGLVMSAVRKIIDSFEEYTAWEWTDTFNYETQTDKWMKALGHEI